MEGNDYIRYSEWMKTPQGADLNKSWEKLKPILSKCNVEFYQDGSEGFMNVHKLGGLVNQYRGNEALGREKRSTNSKSFGKRRALIFDALTLTIKDLPLPIQRQIIDGMNERIQGERKDKLRYNETSFFSHVNPKEAEYMDSLYTSADELPEKNTIFPGDPDYN
ncbi:MAG: hypothetical protein LQ351_008168, partial [Letrouitia transgressa]